MNRELTGMFCKRDSILHARAQKPRHCRRRQQWAGSQQPATHACVADESPAASAAPPSPCRTLSCPGNTPPLQSACHSLHDQQVSFTDRSSAPCAQHVLCSKESCCRSHATCKPLHLDANAWHDSSKNGHEVRPCKQLSSAESDDIRQQSSCLVTSWTWRRHTPRTLEQRHGHSTQLNEERPERCLTT